MLYSAPSCVDLKTIPQHVAPVCGSVHSGTSPGGREGVWTLYPERLWQRQHWWDATPGHISPADDSTASQKQKSHDRTVYNKTFKPPGDRSCFPCQQLISHVTLQIIFTNKLMHRQFTPLIHDVLCPLCNFYFYCLLQTCVTLPILPSSDQTVLCSLVYSLQTSCW